MIEQEYNGMWCEEFSEPLTDWDYEDDFYSSVKVTVTYGSSFTDNDFTENTKLALDMLHSIGVKSK